MKFQQVHNLDPDNLLPYEAFTCPSLRGRWATQPLRGKLVGISAAAEGEMTGLAIEELLPDRTAELLSLYVTPDCRRQGVATRMVEYLERSIAKRNYRFYSEWLGRAQGE